VIDVYGPYFDEDQVKAALAKAKQDRSEEHLSVLIDVVRNHISPVLTAARRAGLPVVYVKNTDPHIADVKGRSERHAKSLRSENCPNCEEALGPQSERIRYSRIVEPQRGDYEILKRGYSGFFGTYLDSLLRNLGIKNLIVVGFDSLACLHCTVIDAYARNYRVILLRDCCYAREFPETQNAQLTASQLSVRFVESLLGYSAASQDFIKALNAMAEGGSQTR